MEKIKKTAGEVMKRIGPILVVLVFVLGSIGGALLVNESEKIQTTFDVRYFDGSGRVVGVSAAKTNLVYGSLQIKEVRFYPKSVRIKHSHQGVDDFMVYLKAENGSEPSVQHLWQKNLIPINSEDELYAHKETLKPLTLVIERGICEPTIFDFKMYNKIVITQSNRGRR